MAKALHFGILVSTFMQLLLVPSIVWVQCSSGNSLAPFAEEADLIYAYPLTSLTFLSCSKQQKISIPYNKDIWASIQKHSTDVLLWMGDAIYPSDSAVSTIREAYNVINNSTEYKELKAQYRLIDGTWDDHDFGVNDGFKSYIHKDESQQLYLDFLNVPENHFRRQRKGVYASHLFGAAEASPNKRVKVICLDTRYHRDQTFLPSLSYKSLKVFVILNSVLRAFSSIFGLGSHYAGDMLGEEQWLWLESQLNHSTASAHILVSSVQLFTTLLVVESWGHFPESRKRLFSLIQKTKPPGLIFLSGDVHFAEILGQTGGVMEVTSSGITHSMREQFFLYPIFEALLLPLFSSNRRRRGDFYIGRNFGVMTFRYEDTGMFVNASVYSDKDELQLSLEEHFTPQDNLSYRYSKLNDIKPLIPSLSVAQHCVRWTCFLFLLAWAFQFVWIASYFLQKSRFKKLHQKSE